MTPEQRAELRIRAEIPGIWGSKVVNDLLDDLATLTRERDEAREALRPFAKAAMEYGDDFDDDYPILDDGGEAFLTIGQLRAAWKVLSATEEQS